MIKANDIAIVYVNYVTSKGGKRRPVLIVGLDDKSVYLYRITSKYKNKSEGIKKLYYPIIDWQKSGLDMQSYVDIGSSIEVDIKYLSNIKSVGYLQKSDQIGLSDFINNANK
ncbi:MazF family toxin-antitoxin system [Companilactobacillus kedongensis]|uniref:MazF family toxin-antitoxin system n=1 Tax=Companilactobacillus kedongensis TaxID=2486004 RepID=UPI000F78171F|nr:MazF family toxin-antitoxin system [Companilactobacillus kedongensis]